MSRAPDGFNPFLFFIARVQLLPINVSVLLSHTFHTFALHDDPCTAMHYSCIVIFLSETCEAA